MTKNSLFNVTVKRISNFSKIRLSSGDFELNDEMLTKNFILWKKYANLKMMGWNFIHYTKLHECFTIIVRKSVKINWTENNTIEITWKNLFSKTKLLEK